MNNIDQSTPKIHANSIDIMDLFKLLIRNKRIWIVGILVGFCLGVVLAFILPVQYKVSTTILPQSESESGLGQFSSLAAIAGFDLNLSNSSAEISPVMYPLLAESPRFLSALMDSSFTFEGQEQPIRLYDYFTKIKKPTFFDRLYAYTVGLPAVVKRKLKKADAKPMTGSHADPSFLAFTQQEQDILVMLSGMVQLSINKKEGYLSLDCYGHEKLFTAQLTQAAMNLLQDQITEYKVKSAQQQLIFVESRYEEKKAAFEAIQLQLAHHIDRNQNVTTEASKMKQNQLQAEYDMIYSVYSELAKTLEQSRIQVKRRTPVFAVIKPAVLPNEKFKPKRSVVVATATIIGFLLSVLYVALRFFWQRYAKKVW